MNIGVITPYDEGNYGAYLQAYATKKYLEANGHKVFFVRYRTDKARKLTFFQNKKNLKARIKKLLRMGHNIENYRTMTNALDVFEVIGTDELAKLDLIILGSDEIWNINAQIFQNDIFFGGKCDNVPVYAYAPSGGNASVEDYQKYTEIMNLMKKVNVIGVRDQNTVKLVKDICGYEPNVVCDPTLLLNIKDYEKKGKGFIKQPYLLVYSYSVDKKMQAYLKQYAKENNLKLVAACMYQSWCDINICCEPLEFLTLINEAECVFTTTFHGSIFTLLQHKRCIINAKSKKVKDLITWTEMKDALIDEGCTYEEFCNVINNSHDYDNFECRLSERREHSRNLYLKALDRLTGEVHE